MGEKNLTPRQYVRELGLLFVFEKMFQEDTAESELVEAAKTIIKIDNNNVSGDDEENEPACEVHYFDTYNEEHIGGALEIFNGVYANIADIDSEISAYSNKRAINRISKIALAILRVAFYEIKFNENVPENVAINEAVRLAAKFATESEVQFVNGLLGAYSRNNCGDKK